MRILKNKKTGQIGKFSCPQGDEWEHTTEDEISSYNLDQAKVNKINELKVYLKKTDWTAIKEFETGKTYPNIKQKRIDARLYINKIETKNLTLEKINNINIEF